MRHVVRLLYGALGTAMVVASLSVGCLLTVRGWGESPFTFGFGIMGIALGLVLVYGAGRAYEITDRHDAQRRLAGRYEASPWRDVA